ncbi:MAG: oligogalacturonate lyase family protein [Ignavibacteriaceae bacterium]
MIRKLFLVIFVLLSFSSCKNNNINKIEILETGSVKPMPDEWIDKDTGHKIIHLIPGKGENRSFYFHNNPFVPSDGKNNEKMIFYRKVNNENQLFSNDLKTHKIDQLTNKKGVRGEIVGKESRKVYYQCRDSVFSTGIESHETRLIYVFPKSVFGSISTLNADETLLAGAIISKDELEIFRKHPSKGSYFERIYEAKLPRSLFTINIASGEMNKIYSEKAWLNHIQFSPTDPELLMFCHEGPWHKVDRIWTININEGKPKLMHKRTVYREIAGHEFFSPDGKNIWYDLQIPRGETFYLASVNIKTGKHAKYGLTRNEWSIHYNISPDEKLFAGDGGDSSQVAEAKDGMWLYLFKIKGDGLKAEKLVNMKHHNYKLEPNVHFSPDGKWIIFRANFEGHSDIYAVEIKKTKI